MRARGRKDVTVRFLDPQGRSVSRPGILPSNKIPVMVLSGEAAVPDPVHWRPIREFSVTYWGESRRYLCNMWATADGL
jgi:hypothetical protein